jgi:hypothetical protein
MQWSNLEHRVATSAWGEKFVSYTTKTLHLRQNKRNEKLIRICLPVRNFVNNGLETQRESKPGSYTYYYLKVCNVLDFFMLWMLLFSEGCYCPNILFDLKIIMVFSEYCFYVVNVVVFLNFYAIIWIFNEALNVVVTCRMSVLLFGGCYSASMYVIFYIFALFSERCCFYLYVCGRSWIFVLF